MEHLVALRMGDDQRVTGLLQFAHGIGNLRGNQMVGKLDEQVALAVDGVEQGVGKCGFNIVCIQVKIASQA